MRQAVRICLVLLGVVLAAPAQDRGPILKDPAQPEKAAAEAKAGTHGPQVCVKQIVPLTSNVGRSLIVEIIVQNAGNEPAERVQVEQELPVRVMVLKSEPEANQVDQRVSWSLGTLLADEERRLKLILRGIAEGDFVSQPVVSHAPASSTIKLTRPRLALRQKEPTRAVVGEEASLVIEVSNPGTGPASGVILQHQLPAGLEHPRGAYLEKDVGALGPGERQVIALPVKAATRGKHVSQVTAKGDDDLEARLEAILQVGQPELKLSHASQGQRYLNTEAIFTLEISNPGDAPARQVVLEDALPAELRFESASHGGRFDKDTRTVNWAFTSLEGGESKRLTLAATATRPSVLRCFATAKAEPKLEATAPATLEVLGVPALLLEVVDADDPVAVGEETAYEIRVINQGSASNTKVQIMALLPDGLALVRAEGEARHRTQGRQVIFEPLTELRAGGETVYRLQVRGTIPGDYRTRVQLQSEQLRIPVCEEESTKVYRD